MKKLNFTRTALKLIVASIALIFCGIARAQYDTSNGYETSTGQGALYTDNSSNDGNTADGYQALYYNTSGNADTAVGCETLVSNSDGTDDTANGYEALYFTTASYNTATGSFALLYNSTGSNNTATGYLALQGGTSSYADTGSDNTADGESALAVNTSGTNNIADGYEALSENTTGYDNTASGVKALEANNTGFNNIAEGFHAMENNTTGKFNIAIGSGAGSGITTGTENIEIGAPGVTGDTKAIRLGTQGTQTKTIIAGIYGQTAASGVEVFIGSNGQLGTMTSSAKFKRNIHDMGSVSDALMALRPVTFQYKTDIDPTGTPQFGLIAEEVEKVNPDLVARDADHHIYTVRYEAVNAMLLNEFQKQHETMTAQQITIARQLKHSASQDETIAAQQKILQSLAARVSELEQARK